jgi:hypothetical protein
MALTTVRGTEFGEIDRPSRGGYTEAGWNKGAFGADLSGTSNQGFALPPSVLKPYGYGQKNFGQNFNNQYEIQVVNPATGQTTVGPLKDLGPGPKTGAGIDILWGSREALGFKPNFSGPVQYQIVPKGSSPGTVPTLGSGSPVVAGAGTTTVPALGSGSPVVAGSGTTTVPATQAQPKTASSYLSDLSKSLSSTEQGSADSEEAERQRQLMAAMYLTPSVIGSNPLAVYQAMQSLKGGGGGSPFSTGSAVGSGLAQGLFKSGLLAPRARPV